MIHTRFLFYDNLNDFLPAPQRHAVIDQVMAEHAAVKHPIESLGVPHPEVEAILVNQQPAGLGVSTPGRRLRRGVSTGQPRSAPCLPAAATAHHAPSLLRGGHSPGPPGSLSPYAGLRHALSQRLRRPGACRHCRERRPRAADASTVACSNTRASSTASAHARSIRTCSSSPCSNATGLAARFSRGGAASTAMAYSKMLRRAQSLDRLEPKTKLYYDHIPTVRHLRPDLLAGFPL